MNLSSGFYRPIRERRVISFCYFLRCRLFHAEKL